jgi:type VI secretion system protein ImpK
MNTVELENSFFLKQFYDFYTEVIAQKKAVEVEIRRSAGMMSSDSADVTYPIYNRLLTLLEEQIPEARSRGGKYGVEFYKEAQYLMAALADDIFLHTDWAGKEEWQSNLLEYKLFGTYVAGDRFFDDVEKLLKARDSSYTEMAVIYFMVLSLGFKGKFWDKDDDGQIEGFRRQLFAFIFKNNPKLLDDKRILLPQVYEHTQREDTGKRLPYMGRWLGLIAAMVVLLLMASHIIWNYSVGDLVETADTINKAGNLSGL